MELTAPYVLIDDMTTPDGVLLFTNPRDMLICTQPQDVAAVLAKIDQALEDGHHVAGYLAYELGYVLEPKLAPLLPLERNGPLIWMGVFDAPYPVDAGLFDAWATEPHSVSALRPAEERDTYLKKIETIREHIRAGDVYQINHTFKQRFDFSGSPLSLFAHLRQNQQARYGALIATGDRHILSLSPELFVDVSANLARTRPMKGTAARAANPLDDEARKHWLCHDEKSKAENLMIVDLLRNDLSRIALVGSVNVTDLFHVETYPTLHQMTSAIEAKLRPGTPFSHLIKALFPCGSVTGAPKVKAMEIIRSLETEPRGVYTGAIGYGAPGNVVRLNVAIRTISLSGEGGREGEMGIGSGIVYDSEPAEEWDECHLKARFLTQPQPSFDLLETLLWEPGSGFALLDRHLQRMADSAHYFGYGFDEDVALSTLNQAIPTKPDTPLKVRLLLSANATFTTEATPLLPQPTDQVWRFNVSEAPISRDNPFVYHKTTNRAFHDDERTRLHAVNGCDEVLFCNEFGELTEGSITNIFLEINDQLLTPALHCGLLAGTLRQDLIDTGRAVEAVLRPADLEKAERIWLGNSVRGLVPATPARPPH
ncbi:aminodeoxychorismate synthase component I [Magnetovibrio blakemorei]|nr:aminodeoxychorismate synthase component I [Magnetovibrio blakemorei]